MDVPVFVNNRHSTTTLPFGHLPLKAEASALNQRFSLCSKLVLQQLYLLAILHSINPELHRSYLGLGGSYQIIDTKL